MKTQPTLPYLNPDLPFDTRLDDLISRMSLQEKVGQMLNECPAIPHLGLSNYN
jgi:beta-glucosidase